MILYLEETASLRCGRLIAGPLCSYSKAIDKMDEQLLNALGYLSEMPLTYAVPAYFGSNRSDTEKYQRNGTASLIKVDGAQWALTNHHVLQGYRDAREIFPDLKFQLGNKIVEPLNLIISESKYYDLVVLDLTEVDASDLATGGNKPTSFYEAPDWPPTPVTESDLLIISGFPGSWRQENGKARFRAFTFSQAGAEVKSVPTSPFCAHWIYRNAKIF